MSHILTAAGDINTPYQVLGVVHATASRTPGSAGCTGVAGLPIQDTYQAATEALKSAAAASGADGVIHIGYDYRMASTTVGCNNTTPQFEVYAWGTAVKLG